MSRRLLITVLLLLMVNLIPIFYYLVKQSATLTENEEMVQLVFEKQVESILYSLNQETENTINQWVNNLDIPVNYSGSLMHGISDRLFLNNPALKQIEFHSFQNPTFYSSFSANDSIKKAFSWADSTLRALSGYRDSGYQRVESKRINNDVYFCFFLKSGNDPIYCSINADLKMMVEQNLRPKIQQAAQDIFVISVNDSTTQQNIFATDSVFTSQYKNRISSWYLPGVWFGIQLKTQTIEQLITDRSRTENYLLITLLLLSLIGSMVIVFSLRKTLTINNMKSEFIANVSHELRTPLGLISLYSETLLLNRIVNDEKRMHYLNVIHDETTRLSDLVNRILNFSRIENNKRVYNADKIELNEVAEEVYAHYQPHFKNNQVVCSFLPFQSDLIVFADREAVIEALSNLIDNAIKYGNELHKQIDILLSCEGFMAVIVVKDNGIGISKRDQRRIFNKFYRVTHGNLAHKAKGAGLGLNIVRHTMKSVRGGVSVSSILGSGSQFKLSFPLINKE